MQNHSRAGEEMDKSASQRAINQRPNKGRSDLREVRTPASSESSAVTQIPAYMRYTPEQEAAFKVQDETLANGGIPTGISMTPEQIESRNEAIQNGTFEGWL